MTEKMQDAIKRLTALGVDLYTDFHALPAIHVCAVLSEAIRYGYQVPKNANGSRARYFYAFVQRSIK